jgi:hypothetical protein
MFNAQSDHPLIARQQTYMLDRKLVSISSEDRDQCHWKNRAQFEITLPQQLLNVETIRLVECNFPSNNYTFKNNYFNTKFLFSIPSVTSNYIIVTINEGFYTSRQLAYELTNKLNFYTSQYSAGYDKFVVVYNEVTQKLQFGNKVDPFSLNFDAVIDYERLCSQINQNQGGSQYWVSQKNATTPLCQNGKWGLPCYLGFEKQEYSSNITTNTQTDPSFNNLTYLNIGDPNYYWLGASGYYINAPNKINIVGETNFYMELDKCNQADELRPYPHNTNGLINNTYNGIVNSFFAKIPILGFPNTQYFDSRNGLIQNLTTFFPPLERLSKVKVKFRYHDGTLVDFSDEFSFTLAFDCYRDEMARTLSLRTPAQYKL